MDELEYTLARFNRRMPGGRDCRRDYSLLSSKRESSAWESDLSRQERSIARAAKEFMLPMQLRLLLKQAPSRKGGRL